MDLVNLQMQIMWNYDIMLKKKGINNKQKR